MTDTAPTGTDALRGLDLDAFGRWAQPQGLDLQPPLTASLVAGGHSCLTYVVTDGGGRRVVVRRPPLGNVLESAHNVVREHRIVHALQHTDVPVAPTLGVCDDTDVIGAPFFVMDHVDGGVLHSIDDVDRVAPRTDQRMQAGRTLVRALAALHQVDIDDVGLGDLSRRTGYLDRQLRRWQQQWEASRTRDLPEMDRLYDWLIEHRPDPSPETRIVHGDFRLGNAILNPDGSVAAMLDWELCTLGEPMADLAYLMRSWVAPDEPASPHLEPPTRAGGFPSREELVAEYAAATGRSVTDLDYWMAFNAWRSAAIAEGVLRRYLDGAMGTHDADTDAFKRGVEISAAAGMRSAGLSD
jgi:aminoglycoside phosphotransferase (APT) family kinase protein